MSKLKEIQKELEEMLNDDTNLELVNISVKVPRYISEEVKLKKDRGDYIRKLIISDFIDEYDYKKIFKGLGDNSLNILIKLLRESIPEKILVTALNIEDITVKRYMIISMLKDINVQVPRLKKLLILFNSNKFLLNFCEDIKRSMENEIKLV